MKEPQSPEHEAKLSSTTSPPHLLVVLREGRVGGAERLVLESLPGLRDAFRLEVTTTPLPWERGEPLTSDDRMSSWSVLRGRADLVYTHLLLPGLIARLGRALGSKARWVHAVHFDSYDGLPLGRLLSWLDRAWVFPAADRLVAVSARVAAGISSRVGPHAAGVRLLENALDLSAAAAQLPATDTSARVTLGTVAMLRQEKGVDDLIRALKLLVDRGVDAELRVAGDGPERDRLERLTADLGLSDRVDFLGYVTPVDDAYQALDVYVQPSRAESFGLAAIESLRHHTPLVVAPDGNLPECAGHGAWGMVAETSGARDEALARAIEQVVSERDAWADRAEQGRRHWAARLDPERRRSREVELLQEALLPRVVHIAPIATQGEGGGLQRQVLLQTRALDARGHRVFLLQRPDPAFDSAPPASLPHQRWAHLTRWEFGPRRLSGQGSRLMERWLGFRFTFGAIPALILRRGRYDVIHAHQLFSPTLIGAVVKRLTGKPLVVRVTASGAGVGEVAQLARLPFRRLRRWAISQIDVAIALTDAMRDELLGAGIPSARIRVIPNAVEIPEEAIEQPRRTHGPYTLLFVGRFSEEKDLETAVRALAELGSRQRDVRLRLVGRADPDRDVTTQLRQLAADLGVADQIEWPGYSTDPADDRADADAFLLPSRSEGMSNALLEAAAAGMVCVVSDIAQNRAVTGDGGARFFPVGNHVALADAVDELVADRDSGGTVARLRAAAARERVMNRHAPRAVATELADVYRAVTSERSSRPT